MLRRLVGFTFAVAVSVMVCAPTVVQAGFLSSTFVSGTNNLYEDRSREAYVDVNGNKLFDVGDVLFGVYRLDAQTSPNTTNLNNQVYVVFSNQVTAISGNVISFGPTTVAGLTLSDLIGSPTPAGSLLAVYDNSSPYSADIRFAAPAG